MSGYRRSRSGSRSFKGRKKVVKEFSIQQGLCTLGIVTLVMLLIFLLWGLGIIRLDAD